MTADIKKLLEAKGRTALPNVLFVAAECAPLSKTGGLADVVGTLPKTLKKFGMDARVITPYHKCIKDKYADKVKHLFHFFVDLGWRHKYCGIEKLELDGAVIYLVDNEDYYGDKIYRGGNEEGEQYAFFCRAVLDALPHIDFTPEIIHCNDWHTAMLPMLARTQYCGQMQDSCRYLLSIHNIAFQGKYDFGFVQDVLRVDPTFYNPEFMELYGCADFLKTGCVFADRISTVSPGYAKEICDPYYAEGLEGILNARKSQLVGILNGIDTDVFDPAGDKFLPATYTADDLAGKAACKKALQKKMGLKADAKTPLIAMVTRMTEQKGFDLVMQAIDSLMESKKVQFALLGTGDAKYETFMKEKAEQYKGRLAAWIGYDEELSHLVYAGADMFLMPSRFEPCGLSQMMALRYGTIPIVRATGGLRDSVEQFNAKKGTGDGFLFENYNADEMTAAILSAVDAWNNDSSRAQLIKNAMAQDFSFKRSAKEYIKLYIDMLDKYNDDYGVLTHDTTSGENRFPFEPAETGELIKLTANVLSGNIKWAVAVVFKSDRRIEYCMQENNGCFSVEFSLNEPGAWKYYFRFGTAYGERYLCPDETGLGSVMSTKAGDAFPLTVYLKGFETPEAFRHGVMYQIFPDRFGIEKTEAVKQGIEYHKKLGQTPELHESVDEPVRYKPRKFEKDYSPDDFYGGTFNGIAQRLPYLKKLGITWIYLNPICEAKSNHRYDAGNYMNADPILGTNEDFTALCSKADELGIKIILDGVYSHTGADSIYFNRDRHYGPGGACSGPQSEFYSWYSFERFPNKYKCWWNFKDLPEVDERSASWQSYVLTGDESVVKTWMRRGAGGWRLDVADELPDDVLALIRQTVKEQNPDAPVIGEVWEDPVTKTGPEGARNYALGYSLDSVMNYPVRFTIIEFLRRQRTAQSVCKYLNYQRMAYPRPMYYALMNLLSSHDVERIRTALATNVDVRSIDRENQLRLPFTKKALSHAVDLQKIAAAIQFTLPGVPCIYYGDEQGMTGVCDPFNRTPFKEDNDGTGLFEYYSELANMRLQSPVLLDGEAAFVPVSDDAFAIIRYLKNSDEKPVILVVNRSEKPQAYEINCPQAGISGLKGKIPAYSAEFI